MEIVQIDRYARRSIHMHRGETLGAQTISIPYPASGPSNPFEIAEGIQGKCV